MCLCVRPVINYVRYINVCFIYGSTMIVTIFIAPGIRKSISKISSRYYALVRKNCDNESNTYYTHLN